MVRIRMRGIEGSELAVEEIQQIQKVYELALNRFAHTIRDVEVWCTDINGPRGGIDKLCRVQLRLHPRGVLTVKSEESSFTYAARVACDKMKALLTKKISKKRCFPKIQGNNDVKEQGMHWE
jgi:putative sigma-54 modulation protein